MIYFQGKYSVKSRHILCRKDFLIYFEENRSHSIFSEQIFLLFEDEESEKSTMVLTYIGSSQYIFRIDEHSISISLESRWERM